jgi:hypothetical protein
MSKGRDSTENFLPTYTSTVCRMSNSGNSHKKFYLQTPLETSSIKILKVPLPKSKTAGHKALLLIHFTWEGSCWVNIACQGPWSKHPPHWVFHTSLKCTSCVSFFVIRLSNLYQFTSFVPKICALWVYNSLTLCSSLPKDKVSIGCT